jgi:hypothetical protein
MPLFLQAATGGGINSSVRLVYFLLLNTARRCRPCPLRPPFLRSSVVDEVFTDAVKGEAVRIPPVDERQSIESLYPGRLENLVEWAGKGISYQQSRLVFDYLLPLNGVLPDSCAAPA